MKGKRSFQNGKIREEKGEGERRGREGKSKERRKGNEI